MTLAQIILDALAKGFTVDFKRKSPDSDMIEITLVDQMSQMHHIQITSFLSLNRAMISPDEALFKFIKKGVKELEFFDGQAH